jgi:hypothetical protein
MGETDRETGEIMTVSSIVFGKNLSCDSEVDKKQMK